MCGRITYANVQSLLTEQHIFIWKRNSIGKERLEIFYSTRWFSLQSLICTIRLFKVCVLRCLKFGSFFSIILKLFFIQTFMPTIKKLLFCSIGTSFFQLISTPLVEKVGFSLTNVNKKIWDKHSRFVPVILFKI